MNEAAGERFAGLTAAEAQAAVVAALREQGLLRAEEPYAHSVPFSHRSGERIEPLISLQWFCRMDELAAPAIEVVERDEVRIAPEQLQARLPRLDATTSGPGASRASSGGATGCRSGTAPRGEEIVAESEAAPEAAASAAARRCARTRTSSTPGSARRCGRSRPSAGPTDRRELRAFYPTDFLTTAREIIFLWVARMVMMGIEFAGDIPFRDVYVHPVIQAPDGRRMSKSLGTGIDPLDEIDVHGADALRFGLLAMSSTQDVRYSAERVQQGRDLANKMWNASRLDPAERRPRREPAADGPRRGRGPLDPLAAASGRSSRSASKLDAYDFAHAALELYAFFWSELCDWYLEIVKPRLYDGDEDASANLLYVLERMLALVHPVMPFVTEEIWALPARRARASCSSSAVPGGRRRADRRRAPRRELGRRDRAGPPRAALARPGRGAGRGACCRRASTASRAARVRRAAGPLRLRRRPRGRRSPRSARSRCSPRRRSTPARRARRLEERARSCGREIERAERKLANEGFVAKAPPEVVEAERAKLAALPRGARGAGRAAAAPGAPDRPRPISRRSSRSACASGSSGSGGWSRCSGCRSIASRRSTSSAPTASPRSPR